MQIRRATVEDVPRIAAVHVRSWQVAYRGLIPQDYLDNLDPSRQLEVRTQRLRDFDWSSGGFLVAEDDADLLGFAHFGATRDQDEPDHVGEIIAIYLASSAWGQGFGRSLMAASLARLSAIGYQQATLWVLDTNARARSFYAKAGFNPDGAVKLDDRGEFQLREVRYRRPLP